MLGMPDPKARCGMRSSRSVLQAHRLFTLCGPSLRPCLGRWLELPVRQGLLAVVLIGAVGLTVEAGRWLADTAHARAPSQPLNLTPDRTPEWAGAGLACPGPQPPPVTDFGVYQTPNMPEPAARVPFRDPVFGTCVVRVTDRTKDIAPDDSSAGLLNEYSRVQSFNADESRILVRGIAQTWYLYDAASLNPLGQQQDIEIDPRWDAGSPNLLAYSVWPTWLVGYNVATGQPTVIHDFAGDFPGQALAAVWTRYEGSPSRDGRYLGLMAQDESWSTVAFLVYDRQLGQVIAQRIMPQGLPEIDSVTISPLGDYFLAFYDYCQTGEMGSDAHPCGLMVYNRELTNGRGLLRLAGHCDTALDAQGREVLVYQDIDTDHISILDLATGVVTPLWPIDYSHTAIGLHFSGQAFDRPGWALVSTYNGGRPTAHTWMDDQVFAVELRAGGQVIRLAHTHSVYDENVEQDYWAEPHASVNRDFTRAVFTSNWGRSGTEEVEMFLIEIPPEWTGGDDAPPVVQFSSAT